METLIFVLLIFIAAPIYFFVGWLILNWKSGDDEEKWHEKQAEMQEKMTKGD